MGPPWPKHLQIFSCIWSPSSWSHLHASLGLSAFAEQRKFHLTRFSTVFHIISIGFLLFSIYFCVFPYRLMRYGRAHCNEYVSQTRHRLPGWSQGSFFCVIPKIQRGPWKSGNDFSFSSLKVESPLRSVVFTPSAWDIGWPVSVSVESWEVCSSGSYKVGQSWLHRRQQQYSHSF